MLEWAAISFSRGSSQTRDGTWVSCIASGHIYSLESDSGERGSWWQQEEHFAPGHWVEIRELWNIDTPTHHPQGGRPDPFREQSMRVGAARCHLLAHSLLLLGSVYMLNFVYTFTLWRTSLLLPNIISFMIADMCTGFSVNINFQLIWVKYQGQWLSDQTWLFDPFLFAQYSHTH